MVSAQMILAGKILIVDDQPSNVQLLELMLQREGYLCVGSTMNPETVCELHLKNRYDLILLDLHMPGMDGFQVMEGLRKIEMDDYVSVLVVTAQPGQKLRALQAGAKDFIGKPFDRLEVLTRIHNMLEIRLLHREEKIHSALLEELVRERTAELRSSEEKLDELRRELAARSAKCVCNGMQPNSPAAADLPRLS